MKLQFSLATLLVCLTVLAVVCGVAAVLPVYFTTRVTNFSVPEAPTMTTDSRSPSATDIAWRLAWAGPIAIAATLATLWTIRRLKSRRENGPPVG